MKCSTDNLREALESLSENGISKAEELITKNQDDAYEAYLANLDSEF